MAWSRFVTHNSDGTPKICKFCGVEVWWDTVTSRWFNTDGKTFHADSCEISQRHYHEKATDVAESRRRRRAESEGR